MPTDRTTGSSSHRSVGDNVVELKEGPDGTFSPGSSPSRLPPPKREVMKRPPIQAKKRVARPRSPIEEVESQVIEGFRLGMGVVKKVSKALNIKL